MTAPAIGAIGAATVAPALWLPAVDGARAAAGHATGFGHLVARGLDHVNRQLVSSQVDLQQLAVGHTENLHQTMIRLEEARLSFQLAMQVRNRVLEAYQDVMKMPV